MILRLLIVAFFIFNSTSGLSQSSQEVSILRDVVYGHAGGVDLKFDVAKPVDGNGPYPAIVFFHGGGWQQGHKSHMHRWLRRFASEGYVSITVGYRFAPEFKWPSQVHDAKAAVRFLRENAKSFNIDPARIGAMGESAGGYLALMLGATDPDDGLEGDGGSAAHSSSVQAVVSFFSAADFETPRKKLSPAVEIEIQKYYGKSLPQVLADFTGAKDNSDPILKKISLFPYIDAADPPVLLFQGDEDPFISVEQAAKLSAAFGKAHVENELVIVKGGGHGWTGDLQDQTSFQMSGFFRERLKAGRP
jgi:acetyl esterase/lipase